MKKSEAFDILRERYSKEEDRDLKQALGQAMSIMALPDELDERDIFFTSECVAEGHPDKVCDIISDSVLDKCLEQDPLSRVAVETLATTGQVVLAGELTTKAFVDFQTVVRDAINGIGYNKGEYFFFGDGVGILNSITSQSPDIAMGVDTGGAGDQGMVFGGAVLETEELMPLPSMLARALTNEYTRQFKEGLIGWARPDAKSQVTVRYNKDMKPIAIDTVLMSVQHDPDVTREEIEKYLTHDIIRPVLSRYGYGERKPKILVNPTGRFVIGGPHGDSGLTGRKIIVDTYGGYFSHGGGAFSGKDPTKVDRSGAYMARYIAKNIVAAGLAEKVEVQISYAIGVVQPVSVYVKCFGTNKVSEAVLEQAVREIFDMSPNGIIEAFSLRNPSFKYADLAAKGHFGRSDIDLPWERIDKIDELWEYLGIKEKED